MTVYRLTDPAVVRLWLALRGVAESRLADLKEIARDLPGRHNGNVVSRDEVEELLKDKAILLDVRPRQEFEAGHLRGAINIPVDELRGRLSDLSRDHRVVTYCRGKYCLFADEAAEFLRANGFDVVRLEGGWPEWQSEGRPVQIGGPR
jgi:rhodanese-related sulfurtransferase